jgi:hypothetical protein
MFFSEIPQPIKEWFGSDSAADELASINDFLGLEGDKQLIIFYALSNLELKKISLEQFYAELQTKLTPLAGEERAQQAIQTINEKILAPIKTDLINFGVLPADWAAAAAPAAQPTEPEIPTEIKQPVAGEQPAGESITPPSPAQTQPAEPGILRPSFKNEPFVFHQAEQPTKPIAQPEQPAFGIGYKISESADAGIKKQGGQVAELVPQTPPTAESKTRVVNYSEFRTPIEKTEAVQPSAEPTPTNQQAVPGTLSQNVVNLKKNGQASAEPSEENAKNTINLKDLPL